MSWWKGGETDTVSKSDYVKLGESGESVPMLNSHTCAVNENFAVAFEEKFMYKA